MSPLLRYYPLFVLLLTSFGAVHCEPSADLQVVPLLAVTISISVKLHTVLPVRT